MPDGSAIRVLDWHTAPLFGRRETILRALHHLHDLHASPVSIVETGTLRNRSSNGIAGDGWSTVAWGWYAGQMNGRVFTVDVSEEALATCRLLTQLYAKVLDYVQEDSVSFLQNWDRERLGSIHYLYLDSLDYENKEQSEAHSLAEAQAALHKLAPSCLVLFDDTYSINGAEQETPLRLSGKGAQAVPYLLSQGFCLEWQRNSQVLLSRPALYKTMEEASQRLLGSCDIAGLAMGT